MKEGDVFKSNVGNIIFLVAMFAEVFFRPVEVLGNRHLVVGGSQKDDVRQKQPRVSHHSGNHNRHRGHCMS